MFYSVARFFRRPDLSHLVEHYDNAAWRWHGFVQDKHYVQAYERLLGHVVDLFPGTVQGRISVLDVGAGSAGFSLALCRVIESKCLDAKPEFVLLDPSAGMLDQALLCMDQYDYPVKSCQSTAEDLKACAQTYDLILCGHVIEHCKDPAEVLTILSGVLNPDGMLVMSVSKPHWCTWMLQVIWRYRCYRVEEFHALLRGAHFKTIGSLGFVKGPPKFTSYGYFASRKKRR